MRQARPPGPRSTLSAAGAAIARLIVEIAAVEAGEDLGAAAA
jgi:hypothetical protein